jgi:glycerate-2-kinase
MEENPAVLVGSLIFILLVMLKETLHGGIRNVGDRVAGIKRRRRRRLRPTPKKTNLSTGQEATCVAS